MPGQFSQRNHAADPHAAAVDGWHDLSVANPAVLLERLGSECTDLQGRVLLLDLPTPADAAANWQARR